MISHIGRSFYAQSPSPSLKKVSTLSEEPVHLRGLLPLQQHTYLQAWEQDQEGHLAGHPPARLQAAESCP